MCVIKDKEEHKLYVGEVKPFMFGICRNDMGIVDKTKVLQSNFMICNVKENYESYMVMREAINEMLYKRHSGIEDTSDELIVHFSKNEQVFKITYGFIHALISVFTPFPFIDKTTGNEQVIKTIYDLFTNEEKDSYNTRAPVSDFRFVIIQDDSQVETVEAAYLKLTALSEGKVPLRSLNLNGIFGSLHNVAWDIHGNPIELDYLRANKMEYIASGTYPTIVAVDKFPRMLQHIIPDDNTRILDSAKVRMGAQLAAGTTVMPGSSYINFNAGTEGPVMVEGRISSSAIVGAGSDVGGGASILGVLSGTDGIPVTIGKFCLLGANSVIGISLGDGCIVDGGIAVLSNTPITITYTEHTKIKIVNPTWSYSEDQIDDYTCPAHILNGLNGIHFRQDALTGKMIAFRSVREVKLNKELH